MIIVLPLAAAMQAPAPISHERKLAAINLLVQSSENQREWTENDRLVAESIAKDAGGEWAYCLRQSEDRLRRSTEAVETVATAVLGSCLTEERLYQRALSAAFRGLADPMQRTTQAEKLVGDLRASRREEIISQLVNDRLSPPKPNR